MLRPEENTGGELAGRRRRRLLLISSFPPVSKPRCGIPAGFRFSNAALLCRVADYANGSLARVRPTGVTFPRRSLVTLTFCQ